MTYNNDKFDEMNEEKSHSGLKMALDVKILTSMGIVFQKHTNGWHHTFDVLKKKWGH